MAAVRYSGYLLFFVLAVILCSCEYEPTVSFTRVNQNVDPPNLSLESLDLKSDTIILYQPTRYSYNFTSDGAPVMRVKVIFDTHTTSSEGGSGYFDINPASMAEGYYKLRMEISTGTGTGSLADKLLAESLVIKREWTVHLIKPVKVKIAFTAPTIENGYLKFHWQKCNLPYFVNYRVNFSDSNLNVTYSKIFNSSDSVSLTDYSFVGGLVDATLYIRMYNGIGSSLEYLSDNLTYQFPVPVTIEDNKDSLTMKWRNIPFNHSILIYRGTSLLFQGKASSLTIPSPGMGNEIKYQFSVKPDVKMTPDQQLFTTYINYTIGKKTDLKFNAMYYDADLNSYFVKHSMFLRRYDGTTLARQLSYDYPWDYNDDYTFALSKDKSKVFTTVNQHIVQLNSSSFNIVSNPQFVPGLSRIRDFQFMQAFDDSLICLSYDTNIGFCNFNTGVAKNIVGFTQSYGLPFNITMSKDGKYMATCGNTSLKVYKVSDSLTFEKIYEAAGNFLECIFDPVNTNNLLVVSLESDYFLHCPDMTLVSTIPNGIKGYAVDFDPVTNYLLFVSEKYSTITVYDFKNDVVKFKCNHHGGFFTEFFLGNNRIFHNSGYELDAL